MSSAEAYGHCRALTRSAAGNFYYGIRLLPAAKRDAMCAVYAFARRIDDIADGALSEGEKRQALDRADAELQALAAGEQRPGDPVTTALAEAMRRFPLPPDALSELLAGARMDIDGQQYERFEDLLVYCHRVAGGIGRLCVAIFGARELDAAWPLADELGVAMQLTNILRDIDEDARTGRVYLPRLELERFGLLSDDEPVAETLTRLLDRRRSDADHRQLDALIHFQARRAAVWFDRGMALTAMLDRRSAACVLAMSGIYRRLLRRIDEDPSCVLGERISLATHQKLLVALAALLGVRV